MSKESLFLCFEKVVMGNLVPGYIFAALQVMCTLMDKIHANKIIVVLSIFVIYNKREPCCKQLDHMQFFPFGPILPLIKGH